MSDLWERFHCTSTELERVDEAIIQSWYGIAKEKGFGTDSLDFPELHQMQGEVWGATGLRPGRHWLGMRLRTLRKKAGRVKTLQQMGIKQRFQPETVRDPQGGLFG